MQLTNIPSKVTKASYFAELWECPLTGEKSLHASVTLMPGEIVSAFRIQEILSKPNYLTVQLNEQEHMTLEPEFLQYINHSCDPNVFFDTTTMVVICLKKIELSEQMTFFYPSTEWSMDRGFDCLCGTEECLGYIQGAAHLQTNILKQYKLSDYIQQKLKIIKDD